MPNFPVLRSEKSGDEYEPRAFDVFGPKILRPEGLSRLRHSKPGALLSGPAITESSRTFLANCMPSSTLRVGTAQQVVALAIRARSELSLTNLNCWPWSPESSRSERHYMRFQLTTVSCEAPKVRRRPSGGTARRLPAGDRRGGHSSPAGQ